jgi:hypothetical protein
VEPVKPLTNRAQNWRGQTTSVTVRLPDPVVAYIDAHLHEDRIHNRSEFLQHWAAVGVKVSEDPEIAEGLEWALEQSDAPELKVFWDVVEAPAEEIAVVYAEVPVSSQLLNQPIQSSDLDEVYEGMLEQFRSKVR